MVKTIKLLLVAGCTVTMVLVANLFFFPAHDEPLGHSDGVAGKGNSADSETGVTRPPPRLSYQWKKGDAMAYTLKSITTVEDQVVAAGGIYHVRVVEDGTGDGRVKLVTLFTGARYESGGTASSNMKAMMEQVPGFLELTVDGGISAFSAPAYLQADDVSVLAALNTAQLVTGDADEKSGWTRPETDTTGTATARYQVDAAGKISKSRTGYNTVSADGLTADDKLMIRDSKFTGSVGPAWISEFRGEESMVFSMKGEVAWTSRTEFSMSATEVDEPLLFQGIHPDDSFAEVRRKFEGDLPEIVRSAGSGSISELDLAAARAGEYAGVSFEAMLGRYAEEMLAAKGHGERMDSIESLEEWLLARPEEAGKLMEFLKDTELTGEMTAGILHALELSSSSIASQKVLAGILSVDGQPLYPHDVLVQAAVAAGGIGEIQDQALMDHLFSIAFQPASEDAGDLRNCSLLALGILSKTNPALGERLATDLTKLIAANDPAAQEDVAVALMTLANGRIRDAETIASARELFRSSGNEEIREEALAYLARSTGDPAEARAALTDRSEAVQSRAVDLLTEPDKMDAAAVVDLLALIKDSSRPESLRVMAAQRMDRQRDAYPEISRTYESVHAGNCPPQLKEALGELLAPVDE